MTHKLTLVSQLQRGACTTRQDAVQCTVQSEPAQHSTAGCKPGCATILLVFFAGNNKNNNKSTKSSDIL
jgi:hypothetical protein